MASRITPEHPAVHWLDAFGKPRGSRDVHGYVALILEGVVKNIAMLRADGSTDCCTPEESQRIGHELFDTVRDRVDRGEVTGEGLEREALVRIDEGVDVNERARIVYAYCHEAELAFDRGDVTMAWTQVVDATRVAAAVGAAVSFRAGGAHAFSMRAKKGAARRHEKAGHATPEDEAWAHQEYKRWKAGAYPDVKTPTDLADMLQNQNFRINEETFTKVWIRRWEGEEGIS